MIEIDYSKDGVGRFNSLMEGRRADIDFMRISDEEKIKLYSLVDETIRRYNEGREDYFKKQKMCEELESTETEFFTNLGKMLKLGTQVKSKLENEVLPNAQKALLNVKKPISELAN